MVMEKVHLAEKLARFRDHWSPKIVGELNGQQVKLVKFLGPFTWHQHDQEDELFLVVKGRFRMEFRDRHIWVEEGEFLIVSTASSIGPWPTKKSMFSCSSPPPPSTPATCKTA